VKSKAPDLLKQMNETHRPVITTQNGEPRAVLQDPEGYQNMRNVIGIVKSISQGEQDIKDGKWLLRAGELPFGVKGINDSQRTL